MFLYLFLYLITILTQSSSTAERTPTTSIFDYTKLSYTAREKYAENPIAKALFKIMTSKQTNLAVTLDVESFVEVIQIANIIGPHICLLKIHAERFSNFFGKATFERHTQRGDNSPFFQKNIYEVLLIKMLVDLAEKHNFLIMEDRKFCDIGDTVAEQYIGGMFEPARWSDLVTVLPLAGPKTIKDMYEALKKTQINAPRGVVMVCQMNTEGNLLSSHYTISSLSQIIELDKESIHFFAGIMNQNKIYFNNEKLDYGILRITEGVELFENTVNGQWYITPKEAFEKRGADIAIVGAAIYNSQSPLEKTVYFKQLCWNAYINRLS